METIWPEVFITGKFEPKTEKPELEALADGFTGWGNCHAGGKPPEKFSEGMAALGGFLGIPMIEDCMDEKAKELGF